MTPSTPIIVDPDIPDGVLNGFNSEGVLIMSMRYMPTFQLIVGSEGDEKKVATWRTSRSDARRIAAIAAWTVTPGHPTAGRA